MGDPNAPDVLRIEKDGPSSYPWTVKIATGPLAGSQVGDSHKTKRDAHAWAERHVEPWTFLAPVDAERSTLTATVSTSDLRYTLARLAKIEAALAAHERVALFIDLHTGVTQGAYRAALAKAHGGDGDPWDDGTMPTTLAAKVEALGLVKVRCEACAGRGQSCGFAVDSTGKVMPAPENVQPCEVCAGSGSLYRIPPTQERND